MTEPLPELNVPTGASKFNEPSGNGFSKWFGDIKQGVSVLGVEVLNRSKAFVVSELAPIRRILPVEGSDDRYARVWADTKGRVALAIRTDGTAEASHFEAGNFNGSDYTEGREDLSGYSRIWADNAGRIALGIRTDGTVHIPQLDGQAAGGGDGPDSSVSGPDIACPGDSLTQGAGGNGTNYPLILAELTGRVVRNLGVGGETSTTIAGRVSPGRPWLATVSGGSIPASGAVQVSLAGDDGGLVKPLLQGTAGVNPVILGGVTGTLTQAGGSYTFTRETVGTAVPAPLPLPVSTEASRTRQGDIWVCWWGTNDGTGDAAQIIDRERAAFQELTRGIKRFLVIGLSTSSAADRAPMDAQFLRAFGRRFINIRAQLATTTALAEAGMVPTQADLEAIAAGIVPPSLRVDATHLNAAGYRLVAQQVHLRMKELNWL